MLKGGRFSETGPTEELLAQPCDFIHFIWLVLFFPRGLYEREALLDSGEGMVLLLPSLLLQVR